jgi:hypothetical protein
MILVFILIIISTAEASLRESTPSKSTSAPDSPLSAYPFGNYNLSYNQSSISFEGHNRISQSLSTISIGGGYYSSHPINYGSEIGGQTWIKNDRSADSMHQDISFAHGIHGDVDVGALEGSRSTDNSRIRGLADTHMMIDENVTEGRVHIGVLQGSDNSGLNMNMAGLTGDGTDSLIGAWKNPDIEIDEDYIGTYHIYKNMTINTYFDQWGGSGGWLDLPGEVHFDSNLPDPRLISPNRIFNCNVATTLEPEQRCT